MLLYSLIKEINGYFFLTLVEAPLAPCRDARGGTDGSRKVRPVRGGARRGLGAPERPSRRERRPLGDHVEVLGGRVGAAEASEGETKPRVGSVGEESEACARPTTPGPRGEETEVE